MLPDVSALPPFLSYPLKVAAYLVGLYLAVRTGSKVWDGAGEASRRDAEVEAAAAGPAPPAAVANAVTGEDLRAFMTRQAEDLVRLQGQVNALTRRVERVEQERDASREEARVLRGRVADQEEIITDLLNHREAIMEWAIRGGAEPPGPEYSWRVREALAHERTLHRQRTANNIDQQEE